MYGVFESVVTEGIVGRVWIWELRDFVLLFFGCGISGMLFNFFEFIYELKIVFFVCIYVRGFF